MVVTHERRLSAGTRKIAVVVMYGAYAAAAGLWAGAGGLTSIPLAASVVALFALVFAALGILFRGTRYWKWGNAPDICLDEFQIASRNAAYKSAYVIVSVLALTALFAERILHDTTAWSIDDRARDLIFWGWFLLVLTLPAAILVWTEKPVDDDETDARL